MRISTTLLPVVCLLVVLTVCSLETVTVPVSAQTRDAKSAKKARQKTRNAGPKGTGTYEEYPVPRDEVICFSLYTVSEIGRAHV